MKKGVSWITVAVFGIIFAFISLRGVIRDMFTSSPRIEAAYCLLDVGKYEQAEKSAREYLALYPDDARGRFLLAQILMRREDPPAGEILALVDGSIDRLGRSERPSAWVVKGLAQESLHQLRAAEESYLKAVKLDLRTPRAVWLLMELYYFEGRDAEGEALMLRRIARERSASVRAGFLRDRIRHDVQPLAAAGLIEDLEAPYRLAPDDPHVAAAYGRALVRDGALDEGLEVLKTNRDRHGDAESWLAYLSGLDVAGDVAEMKSTLASLPSSFANDPRFDDLRGQVALNDQDYSAAVAALDSYLSTHPADRKALFRLERALRLGGLTERADEVAGREHDVIAARAEEIELYPQIASLDPRALAADSDLCRRLASLRERLGHPAEAAAWAAIADPPGKANGAK